MGLLTPPQTVEPAARGRRRAIDPAMAVALTIAVAFVAIAIVWPILIMVSTSISPDAVPVFERYVTGPQNQVLFNTIILGTSVATVGTLIGVLPEGMVKVGHKLERVTDQGERATLEFANGERVEADLVVGADGIRSTVRQQLFSDQQPRFAGERAYRVVVDADAAGAVDVEDGGWCEEVEVRLVAADELPLVEAAGWEGVRVVVEVFLPA